MAVWTRRRFIQGSAPAAALAGFGVAPAAANVDDGWRQGDLLHLVPGASHERIVIKCSFHHPRTPPVLRVEERRVRAQTTDTEGRYFAFDVADLAADHTHILQLHDAGGEALTDPWPLATYPAPDASPESVRLLAYTCAGGYPTYGSDPEPFLSLALRQRLLARALSFRPHAAIAIGDHVYWDQRTQLESDREAVRERAEAWYAQRGRLDRSLPAKGTANEAVIKQAVEPQFAELYGVMLRSTPSYFVSDDHDYYENDEATDRFVTLPPHAYQLSFARFTRELFMPEFLPDPARPLLMSGAGAGDRAPGISESFGTFRYGNLVEALIYDCARFLSLKGDVAGLVPPEAEAWLAARTADESVRHLFHVPSHPFGWSAGKWRECIQMWRMSAKATRRWRRSTPAARRSASPRSVASSSGSAAGSCSISGSSQRWQRRSAAPVSSFPGTCTRPGMSRSPRVRTSILARIPFTRSSPARSARAGAGLPRRVARCR